MGKKITFKKQSDIRRLPEHVEHKIDQWVSGKNAEEVIQQDMNKELKPIIPNFSEISNLTDLVKKEEQTIRINFNVPEAMHRKLKVLCAQQGITIKDKILALLEKELSIDTL